MVSIEHFPSLWDDLWHAVMRIRESFKHTMISELRLINLLYRRDVEYRMYPLDTPQGFASVKTDSLRQSSSTIA
jgi:hypothetical protein